MVITMTTENVIPKKGMNHMISSITHDNPSLCKDDSE